MIIPEFNYFDVKGCTLQTDPVIFLANYLMVPMPVSLEVNITKHFIHPLACKYKRKELEEVDDHAFFCSSSVVLMLQEQAIFLAARYKWDVIFLANYLMVPMPVSLEVNITKHFIHPLACKHKIKELEEVDDHAFFFFFFGGSDASRASDFSGSEV